MFVFTEDEGFINLNSFTRVDIFKDENVWSLHAFIGTDSTDVSGFSLAQYADEVQAWYSLCHLYSALEAGKSAWAPREVGSFSDLWGEVKKNLSTQRKNPPFVPLRVLDALTLKITGLREITIENIRNTPDSITDPEKESVQNKLKNTLTSVDPMDAVTWEIKWEASLTGKPH